MLVFGDAERIESPRSMLGRIAEITAAAATMPAGIARHGRLVGAFIEAGELLQGVADADFAARGEDAPSGAQSAATALLVALAGAVAGSWRSGFADLVDKGVAAARVRLEAAALPESVTVRLPEGYAFYALYPEAYFEAAARLPREPTRVVGLRSIGTGLAAMVAVGASAGPPVTLRPIGHPFDRRLSLSPELAAALLAEPHPRFAVVDEGPGLSGSSFGAIAALLEDGGVAARRIHFFPGHAGDLGPQANDRHRRRWSAAARHVVSFEELILDSAEEAHRLETWFADLLGPAEAPLVDLSGGAWRSRKYARDAEWPAVNAGQERRKYLLRTERGSFLLKFAGLGAVGEAKLDRARTLHRAGFTPEPVAWRHGFFAERWLEDATPLDPDRRGRPVRLLATVADYLAFRATAFPVGQGRGASLERLLEMAQRNIALGLGEAASARLERWRRRLPDLERRVHPVGIDGRMLPHEWVETPDGRLWKTDALDHSAGHDLVGCQDIAWDLVAAEVELGFDQAETRCLRARLAARTGREQCTELHEFLRLCYLAFRLGYNQLAAHAAGENAPERERLDAAVARYRRDLAGLVA